MSLPAISRVHATTEDVKARLASLGLTEEPLLHAASRWTLAWDSFTANHPSFAIGIAAWMEAVAALRDGLLPIGWVRSDERNYALVIHPDKSMAINVATADAGTGRASANVSNKALKGVSTADAISLNQVQLELALPVPEIAHSSGDDAPLTWFLLLYRNENEVRCELSLPSEISPDGRITRWQERILLPTIALDGTEIDVVSPDVPNLDINVQRKA
jgi:hypothetical protein